MPQRAQGERETESERERGRRWRPSATSTLLPSTWQARRRSRPPAHVRGGGGGVGEDEAGAESWGSVRLRARCLVTARGGRCGAAVARLHVEVLLAGGGDRVRLALVDHGGPLGNQRRFLRSLRARHRQNLHGACTGQRGAIMTHAWLFLRAALEGHGARVPASGALPACRCARAAGTAGSSRAPPCTRRRTCPASRAARSSVARAA